jgi:hypothetical protein
MNREDWLQGLAEMMEPVFEQHGYAIPKVRMSVGFPSQGSRGKSIGQCWDGGASADGTHEILIRPDRHEELDVAQILCHELIHAAVGIPAGHGKLFKRCALKLGLQGPMRSTTAGPHFIEWVTPLLGQLGQLPHARLGFGQSSGPKKQGTRLLKSWCAYEGCGYTVRLAKMWAAKGAPYCPIHGVQMAIDMPPDDPDDSEDGRDKAPEAPEAPIDPDSLPREFLERVRVDPLRIAPD